MTQTEVTILHNMRRKAKTSQGEAVHVYPTAEKDIHTLLVNEASLKANFECAVSPTGQVCFCEPDIEDYVEYGGGQLVIHKKVAWQ
jgi:hypothetical protein